MAADLVAADVARGAADPDKAAPPSALTAYEPIKARIAARAAAFRKPVLLLQGDSHSFLVDTPAGMPANLTRLARSCGSARA
jgi:hypothetical protein